MKGDKHKDKDTPEKCETIYRGGKREMPTHGGHEQKSMVFTATCIDIALYAVKKGARVYDARGFQSQEVSYVQSAMQKYLPGAVSDP